MFMFIQHPRALRYADNSEGRNNLPSSHVACAELQIDDAPDDSEDSDSLAEPPLPDPEVDPDIYVPPAPVAAPRGVRSLQPGVNSTGPDSAATRPSSAPVFIKTVDQAGGSGKDARPLTTLAGARARPRLDYSDDTPSTSAAVGAGAGVTEARSGDGSSDVEYGDISTLLWHESDTRVKSIVGNARIERMVPIKLDESQLPFAPVGGALEGAAAEEFVRSVCLSISSRSLQSQKLNVMHARFIRIS
jgi:hypothetical protein